MKISALARSLGISRQMVYELANQRMPTNITELARAWRIQTLNIKKGESMVTRVLSIKQ